MINEKKVPVYSEREDISSIEFNKTGHMVITFDDGETRIYNYSLV